MKSSESPVISVCVCTHNGALRIEDTLWSLICQTADAGTYEILVIDNASDDTLALETVIQRLEGHAFPITLIGEGTIGLSHAKNRAVAESRGDYVYFIDDDALANPRLVEHYLDAISAYSPDVLGGSVLPLFAAQPPVELDYRYWPGWSLKHFGDQDRWLGEGEHFLGGNQAVARQVLEANPFDPDLGRRGEILTGREEWYLGAATFTRRFVSGGYIFHKIDSERMTATYIARRMLGDRSSARRMSDDRSSSRREASLLSPVRVLLRLVAEEFSLGLRRFLFAVRLRLVLRKLDKTV